MHGVYQLSIALLHLSLTLHGSDGSLHGNEAVDALLHFVLLCGSATLNHLHIHGKSNFRHITQSMPAALLWRETATK